MKNIRSFIFKLKRGLSWFWFSFKQRPWQEDIELFETIEKALLDTANYFESREKKGWLVGVDNKANVEDMRLAAKLIRMKLDGHYFGLYCDSLGRDAPRDYTDVYAADLKDDRAAKIAMKIISEKGFHWWI